jgi:hypothetical protein
MARGDDARMTVGSAEQQVNASPCGSVVPRLLPMLSSRTVAAGSQQDQAVSH